MTNFSIRSKDNICFWIDWTVVAQQSPFVALALDTYVRKSINDLAIEACGNVRHCRVQNYMFNPQTYKSGALISISVRGIDGIQRAAIFDQLLTDFEALAEEVTIEHRVTTYGLIQPRIVSDSSGNFWASNDVVAKSWKAPQPNIHIPYGESLTTMRPTHFVVLGEINKVNTVMAATRDYFSRNSATMNCDHKQFDQENNSNQAVILAVNNNVMVTVLSAATYKLIDIHAVNTFLQKVGYKPLQEVEFT